MKARQIRFYDNEVSQILDVDVCCDICEQFFCLFVKFGLLGFIGRFFGFCKECIIFSVFLNYQVFCLCNCPTVDHCAPGQVG
ncbi:MAG: hypothetical protein RR053_06270, partial [Evtepia sp.]